MRASRTPRLLLVVLGAAFVAQTVALAWRQTPAFDETVYRGIARNIHRTGLPVRDTGDGQLFTNSPPLALYANALLQGATGDRLPLTRCLSAALFGTLIVLLVASLSRRAFGRRAPPWTLAALAVIPMFGPEIASVEVDVPLIVLTLWIARSWIRRNDGLGRPGHGRRVLVLGLALALAGIVKYSALLIAPVIAADVLWSGTARAIPWRRRIGEVATLAALPVLGLVLWQLLALSDGKNLFDTFTRLGGRVAGEVHVSTKQPIPYVHYLRSLAISLSPSILILAALGSLCVLANRSGRRRGLHPILLTVAVNLAFFSLVSRTELRPRYQDVILPLLAILAARPLMAARWRWCDQVLAVGLALAIAGAGMILREKTSTLMSPIGIALIVVPTTLAGAWLVVARFHSRIGTRTGLAWAPLLATAIALPVLRSPLLRDVRMDGYDFGREAGRHVAAVVPRDATVGVSQYALGYHADRRTFLMSDRKDMAPIIRNLKPAAVVFNERWIREHRFREGLEAELARSWRRSLRSRKGVLVYFPR